MLTQAQIDALVASINAASVPAATIGAAVLAVLIGIAALKFIRKAL